MIHSGAEELATRVSHNQNFAYLGDITVPGVADWIRSSGLTAEECAMIQPGYCAGAPAPQNYEMSVSDATAVQGAVFTQEVTIRVDDNAKIKMLRSSIQTVVTDENKSDTAS